MDVFSAIMTCLHATRYIAKYGKGYWDAPKTFQVLLSEVCSMIAALDMFKYPECRTLVRWLCYHRKEQSQDLHRILKYCKITLLDMMDFLNIASAYPVKEFKKMSTTDHYDKLAERLLHNRLLQPTRTGSILSCIRITLKDIQPLRDQTAVPTRALNIFLVSMTIVTIKYNNRLSGDPELWDCESTSPRAASPVVQQSSAFRDWEVVGKSIAFKHPSFSQADLAQPGVEREISAAAERIIQGKTCCKACPSACLCHYHPVQGRLCPPSNDPFQGKSFIAVDRDENGRLEFVRRRRSSHDIDRKPLDLF